MKQLTVTSYALLAHLAVQPWSAYDLAQQMTRGFDLVWPRAASAIYEEPKHLVTHGLAKARTERVGRRNRTIYEITPKGRRALRTWMATPSRNPQLESEDLIRVFFGENGEKDDLLATIGRLREYGESIEKRLLAQISGYLEKGAPFPDRWHLIAVGASLLLRYAAAFEEWGNWAEAEVKRWPSTGPEAARRGERIMKQLVTRMSDSSRTHP